METAGGNQSEAARILRIGRDALQQLVAQLVGAGLGAGAGVLAVQPIATAAAAADPRTRSEVVRMETALTVEGTGGLTPDLVLLIPRTNWPVKALKRQTVNQLDSGSGGSRQMGERPGRPVDSG